MGGILWLNECAGTEFNSYTKNSPVKSNIAKNRCERRQIAVD